MMTAVAKAVASAKGPHQQVEAGFAAYFRFVADHPNAFRVLFGSGSRRDQEFADTVRAVEASIADAVAALIEADIAEEHRRLLAHGIVGLAEGTGRHWVTSGQDLDPEQVARRIADLAWAGLRGIRPT